MVNKGKLIFDEKQDDFFKAYKHLIQGKNIKYIGIILWLFGMFLIFSIVWNLKILLIPGTIFLLMLIIGMVSLFKKVNSIQIFENGINLPVNSIFLNLIKNHNYIPYDSIQKAILNFKNSTFQIQLKSGKTLRCHNYAVEYIYEFRLKQILKNKLIIIK